MSDFKYECHKKNSLGQKNDVPIKVKLVLLDDEARDKLRNGTCEFLDDVFGAAITWGIWGGLIGYWTYSYYH